MRLTPRPPEGRSLSTYMWLRAGSVKSMLHLVIASRSLIPGVVSHLKIERKFISLSSLRKGNVEQASDYGSAPVSSTVLVVQYAFGAHAVRAVRAHVSQSSCLPSKPPSLRSVAFTVRKDIHSARRLAHLEDPPPLRSQ